MYAQFIIYLFMWIFHLPDTKPHLQDGKMKIIIFIKRKETEDRNKYLFQFLPFSIFCLGIGRRCGLFGKSFWSFLLQFGMRIQKKRRRQIYKGIRAIGRQWLHRWLSFYFFFNNKWFRIGNVYNVPRDSVTSWPWYISTAIIVIFYVKNHLWRFTKRDNIHTTYTSCSEISFYYKKKTMAIKVTNIQYGRSISLNFITVSYHMKFCYKNSENKPNWTK